MAHLTNTERAILRPLTRQVGQFVPSRALVAAVWGERLPRQPMPALRVHITALRRKLMATGFRVEGRNRHGYRLKRA